MARGRKSSPAAERRRVIRLKEQAKTHAGDVGKMARQRVDHLSIVDKPSPEINAAASAAADLEVMYETHRRGKALFGKEAEKHFEHIKRTEFRRPSEAMREENSRHRKVRKRKERGE